VLSILQISSQNEIIRRLQSELHQIERTAEETVRRTRVDAERQEAADKKNSDGKMGKLQHDLGQVRAQYGSLLAQHRESEQALRKVFHTITWSIVFTLILIYTQYEAMPGSLQLSLICNG